MHKTFDRKSTREETIVSRNENILKIGLR